MLVPGEILQAHARFVHLMCRGSMGMWNVDMWNVEIWKYDIWEYWNIGNWIWEHEKWQMAL